MKLTVMKREEVEVAYLKVEAGVRYWEDATVNGVEENDDAPTIPCKVGDTWAPTIELSSGRIEGWPRGTTADIHYKVCDAGRYSLLDSEFHPVAVIDGYVPEIMSPAENGYGDYIIMHIGPDGVIAQWEPSLKAFEGLDAELARP